MGKRDEFTAETKRTLAARAGNHCSNPQCARSTSGAARAEAKAASIGVAAHISGAASGCGSVRYDPAMSSEDRRSINNGIWLCHVCSDLIDKDKDRYTVPFLKDWKAAADQRAADALAGGQPLGPVRSTLDPDDADEAFLKGLNLPTLEEWRTGPAPFLFTHAELQLRLKRRANVLWGGGVHRRVEFR